MSNVHLLPDQRIPKAIDDILQILYDLDPPIHVATAVGILELCKIQLMSEKSYLDED
jgi:hypothetical protein